MKETGTDHWLGPNTDATNSSGFTGLAGGSRETSMEHSFTFNMIATGGVHRRAMLPMLGAEP